MRYTVTSQTSQVPTTSSRDADQSLIIVISRFYLRLGMAPLQLVARGCSTCHDTPYVLVRTIPIAISVAFLLGGFLLWWFSKPCRHRRERRALERRQARSAETEERRRQRRQKWRATRQAERDAGEEMDAGPANSSIHNLESLVHNSQHAEEENEFPERPPPTYQAATGQTAHKTVRDPNPNSLLNV